MVEVLWVIRMLIIMVLMKMIVVIRAMVITMEGPLRWWMMVLGKRL